MGSFIDTPANREGYWNYVRQSGDYALVHARPPWVPEDQPYSSLPMVVGDTGVDYPVPEVRESYVGEVGTLVLPQGDLRGVSYANEIRRLP